MVLWHETHEVHVPCCHQWTQERMQQVRFHGLWKRTSLTTDPSQPRWSPAADSVQAHTDTQTNTEFLHAELPQDVPPRQ